MKKLSAVILILFVCCSFSFAQSEYWKPVKNTGQTGFASDFQRYELDEHGIKSQLKKTWNGHSAEVMLPDPEGNLQAVLLWESNVLPEKLAYKYPGIKTYGGYVKDKPWRWVRADFTYAGFHALFQTGNGLSGIVPEKEGSASAYQVFYKKNELGSGLRECGYDLLPRNQEYAEQRRQARAFGPGIQAEIRRARQKFNGSMLLYRLAISATGEYSANHGGTKPLVLSAITTSVNNINAVLGSDMNLQFQLIANNDTLIYLNASTDPFTPSNAIAMLDSSQAVLDRVIGRQNFDLGHVITHGWFGGIRSIALNLLWSLQGQGYSSNIPSSGPLFDIDYLAHEIGHQLGAPHNFSATSCFNVETGNLNEPGSGSTIMCYAGTCGGGDNVQGNSDAMYHATSIADYASYLASPFFGNCPTAVPTGNSLPVANAGTDLTIPRLTPFHLIGSATDANNSGTLTYSWEQIDGNGSETAGSPSPDSTNNALFRAFLPVTSPGRTFPNITDLASGTATPWEVLPDTGRNMNFTFIVRDNNTFFGSNAGDVDTDNMRVTVNNNAGPFVVSYPNGGENLTAGFGYTLTWTVAGTNGIAPAVTLELSDDGGLTYPYPLVSNTANDGSEFVILPGINTTTARLRVRSAGTGHFFFDISNTNFEISGTLANGLGELTAQVADNAVLLNWELDRQPGMESLVLERMEKNGSAFAEIATISLQPASRDSYSWRDAAVQGGRTYAYRLAWLDAQGSRHFGNTAEVEIPFSGLAPVLYPNPVSETLWISGCSEGQHEVRILGPDGRLVSRHHVQGESAVLDLGDLSAGLYFVELFDGSKGRFGYKIARR
ncbi:MAG: M12 family metallo-peptidase [Bacteroidia bacterium]